jgi:SCP-2 sterol transfer family
VTGKLQERGLRAVRGFVRRSGDRRLERTLGSERGLARLFRGAAARFSPEHADGFTGEIQFDLRRSRGETSHWFITVAHDRATAHSGTTEGPALTADLAVADAIRILASELDVGTAILEGRLDLTGDFGVAMQLGAMFGGGETGS